jgi:hypothetical protein
MSVRECPDRWLSSLRGQVVTLTGVVNVDGRHLLRSECEMEVRKAGGSTATDLSGRITLLVEGDLGGKAVTDPTRGYSKELVAVQEARQTGLAHVHVVDPDGFADLVDGLPARCRNLRGSGNSVRVVPEPDEGVLGGPLQPNAVTVHSAAELARDLSALDAGTKAHQETVEALAAHLHRGGHLAQRPRRGAPLFDIGWQDGARVYIGEVKSLRETDQDQQIRLGIGQLLDYSHQLEANSQQVTPVLVLERKPTSIRWAALADAHGLLMTYGPRFPGIQCRVSKVTSLVKIFFAIITRQAIRRAVTSASRTAPPRSADSSTAERPLPTVHLDLDRRRYPRPRQPRSKNTIHTTLAVM